MARTITKEAVDFEEVRIVRRTEDDGQGGIKTSMYALVGYTVTTDDPTEVIKRKREQKLTGGNLTRANNIFAAVETFLKSEEEIP